MVGEVVGPHEEAIAAVLLNSYDSQIAFNHFFFFIPMKCFCCQFWPETLHLAESRYSHCVVTGKLSMFLYVTLIKHLVHDDNDNNNNRKL